MSAAALKQRLREDLKAAMQARSGDEIRLLRNLIATLDNAEAISVEGEQVSALPRAFGDATGERPRRQLDTDEVDALIAGEIEARLSAAADYDRHQCAEDATRLRGEAALIERYRMQ